MRPFPAAVFRPWRSFPTMIVAGLLAGLLIGDRFPYAEPVATVALVAAMTFALSEVRWGGVSLRREARAFGEAVAWNYGALGVLLLAFALLSPDPDLRAGWVVMAAVPSAILVIPMTSILRGDTRGALVSSALLYLLSLAVVPAFALAFTGRGVALPAIAVATVLQIGLPIVLSRGLVRVPALVKARPVGVNLSFFVAVAMVVAANRSALQDLGLVAGLAGEAALRTFGIGLAVLGLAVFARRGREERIRWTLFASFKNLALTAILALSLFGARAAIPAIVALLFEILWLAVAPFAIRRSDRLRGAAAP